jgi:hypothetical protein
MNRVPEHVWKGDPYRLLSDHELLSYTSSFIRKGIATNADMAMLVGCIHTVRHFMGQGWVEKNVIPRLGDTASYLKRPKADTEDGMRWQCRVSMIAEALFSVQRVPNFGSFVDHARSRNDIQSVFSELLTADMVLRNARLPEFNPVKTNGAKSVDILVRHGASREIPVEIKSRMEGGDFSPSSFENTIKGAREQIPKASQGIVIVHVPESWGRDDTVLQLAGDEVDRAFRRSSRLRGVEMWWEVFRPGSPCSIGIATYFVRRPETKLFPLLLSEGFGSMYNPCWRSIRPWPRRC